MTKDDKLWKDKLSQEEYYVTRCSGTEPPFTGKYYNHKETGTYNCNCCKNPLFSSDVKYDSGLIIVYRINKDGGITNIADIHKDGKREDYPKELQITTFKKIK